VGFAGRARVVAYFVTAGLEGTVGALNPPAGRAAARASLRETGLFSTVQVALGEAPDADGRLPVTIDVTERKHRSIGLGARPESWHYHCAPVAQHFSPDDRL
jgi:translocation and assembly module TamA